MNKERPSDTLFGELPFKTIARLEFKINGLQSREDAAFLQYQLLLKPEILQCHLEFENQTGTLLFNPLDATAEKILQELPAPFKGQKVSEKKIPYKRVLKASFHL